VASEAAAVNENPDDAEATITNAVSATDRRVAGVIEQIRSVAPLTDADVARATGTTDEVAAG
jgi:hypothetical protein